mgnify:CR=1 FL=1
MWVERLGVRPPRTRFAARFGEQANVADAGVALHRLYHVINGEERDGRSGQSLHLHACFAGQARGGGGGNAAVIDHKINANLVEHQRMAEWDEVAGAFGRHYPRDPRGGDYIPLGRGAIGDCRQRGGGEGDAPGRDRFARAVRLGSDIDHLGRARRINMGEGGHCLTFQQLAGCHRHIILPHQAFADKKGVDPALRHALAIIVRKNAAFADQ